MSTQIKYKKVREHAKEPDYAYPTDAGWDLYAAETVKLDPWDVQICPVGIALELPEGLICEIRSKSGLSGKYGVFCLNSPGTIDPGYVGEVGVILANFSYETKIFAEGDKVAQMVLSEYTPCQLKETDTLEKNESERSSSGFGSSGYR
jgi:dUTP pyrophosphatase